MKKNNPHTPIMLREAMGVEPRVFARYGMYAENDWESASINYLPSEFGKEKQESLTGMWAEGLIKTGRV